MMSEPEIILPDLPMSALVDIPNATAVEYAVEFARAFSLFGFTTRTDVHEEWVLLTITAGDVFISVGLANARVPNLSDNALPVRFALEMEFGLPSGGPISQRPDFFFSLPTQCTLSDFFTLCQGQWTPKDFTELLNFSVRQELTAPRKLPSCILLMLCERTQKTETGDRWFELWTQSGSEVSTHILPRTNNPHHAAQEAAELGYGRPTVYLCQSGQFVAFTTTSGGAFI